MINIKKYYRSPLSYFLFGCLSIVTNFLYAQNGNTGVNTLDPKANLHIEAFNMLTPENEAGIMIPSVAAFAATNPGTNQNGMLVFKNGSADGSFEGFYYWDSPNDNWEFIVSSKIASIDLNKLAVVGTNFTANILQGNTSFVKIPLVEIQTPNLAYLIDGDGDLVIAKTGQYYLYFTGSVRKNQTPAFNVAENIITSIFINGVENTSLSSNNVFPSTVSNERAIAFTISGLITLTQGDEISIWTRRVTAIDGGTVVVNSPYTVILSYLE